MFYQKWIDLIVMLNDRITLQSSRDLEEWFEEVLILVVAVIYCSLIYANIRKYFDSAVAIIM